LFNESGSTNPGISLNGEMEELKQGFSHVLEAGFGPSFNVLLFAVGDIPGLVLRGILVRDDAVSFLKAPASALPTKQEGTT
jgi:hypothetical protein